MKSQKRFIFYLLFVISFTLYFYRYPKMLTFDADQQFYANQYLLLFQEHKLTLLGIETSVGGMFVGPFYTYISSLVYWLFRGDPIGIFLTTLFFASFQPVLTFYLFAKLKNEKAGFIAALLVLLSSSLWNKAFAPSAINFLYPMGLFFFYALVKLKENKKYFLYIGILLASAIHIHFSLFFFFPITLIFLLWHRLIIKKNIGVLFKSILMVSISLSPLIIFDLRHKFFITKNLWSFIIDRIFTPPTNINSSDLSFIPNIFSGLVELFSHILTPKPGFLVYVFLAGVLIFFVTKVVKGFKYKVISLIYAVSIALFILYRGPLPDYFFYFLLAPFFFVTSEFILLLINNKLFKYPVYLFLILLILNNFQFMNTTLNHYNYRLKKEVAEYIKSQSQGKKVKISYDTDLGLGFGFDYLIRYTGVIIDNNNFEENYHIVIRNYENYPGKEFRESGSPVSIRVVKIPKR